LSLREIYLAHAATNSPADAKVGEKGSITA
jgi:hypothetical protein